MLEASFLDGRAQLSHFWSRIEGLSSRSQVEELMCWRAGWAQTRGLDAGGQGYNAWEAQCHNIIWLGAWL